MDGRETSRLDTEGGLRRCGSTRLGFAEYRPGDSRFAGFRTPYVYARNLGPEQDIYPDETPTVQSRRLGRQ
jgi:hypothetical protein